MRENEVLGAEVDTAMPSARLRLKGAIPTCGYRFMQDFAVAIGISRVHLSRILAGAEFPSAAVQRRMAAELGVSLRELREML